MSDVNEEKKPQESRPERPRARKYRSLAEIAAAMEFLVDRTIDGTIGAGELKVMQGALKTIADLLPKENSSAATPICDRLRERLKADPTLLNDLSALLSREQIEKILRED